MAGSGTGTKATAATEADWELVTLPQAKNYLHKDAAETLHIEAEYVGTGDGVETDFDIDNIPIEGSLKLYLNNELLTEKTHYTLSGATVTFIESPADGYPITTCYEYIAGDDTFESYDDELITFLIKAATKKAEDYTGRVFIQREIIESHNGDGTNTLRLEKAPVTTITSVSSKRIEGKMGDGSTIIFLLVAMPTANSLSVYIDGTAQTEGTDYTLSCQKVTFTTAPDDGLKIIFRYSVNLELANDYTEKLHVGRLKGTWLKDYEYEIVYTAGYGADRDAAQIAVPEAVLAVLAAVAVWHENRLGFSTESISDVGSVKYSDPGDLPAIAKQYLSTLSRNII